MARTPQKRRCAGHNTNGDPCDAWAIKGGVVCVTHGGKAPQVQAAAKDRLDRQVAADAVKKLGLEAVDAFEELDPRDVLGEELWRSHATERLLRALVNDLSLDEHGIYGETYHVSGMATGEAKPHVLWGMWMDERRHLKTVAAEAQRAGLEVRRQELAERTAAQVAEMLRAVFADPALDLTQSQQQTGRQVAARHLRAA